MAWRTRSRRRGFGGSGGPLSWDIDGTRRPPSVGSVEWWPRGLASRMAMSWKATYGIGTRPRKSAIGYTGQPRSLEGRTVAGCQRSWQRSAPWLTSDHDFEAELERPIRLQVVAGPRFEPTTWEHPSTRGEGDSKSRFNPSHADVIRPGFSKDCGLTMSPSLTFFV